MKRNGWLPLLIPSILIILGLLCFALVWRVSIPWISWTGGAIGFIFLYLGLFFLSNSIDHYYNAYVNKHGNGSGEPRFHPSAINQKRIYYWSLFLFVLFVAPITASGSRVENYLNWKKFVMDVVIVGGIASFLLFRLYMKRYKVAFDNTRWDDEVKTVVFLAPLFLILHTMVWYNYLSPSPVIRQVKAVVDDPGSKYVHLRFEGKRQRFQLSRKLSESLLTGDSLLLTIKKGALDYAYVSEAVKLN